jgi:hypothetical protein
MSIPIQDVPLGSTVSYDGDKGSYHNDNFDSGDVIVKQFNQVCIGFKVKPNWHAWKIGDDYILEAAITAGQSVPNINDYLYGWWYGNEMKVQLCEEPIRFPAQVCMDCKIPAPHAKPNVGLQFVCASCIVLRELT